MKRPYLFNIPLFSIRLLTFCLLALLISCGTKEPSGIATINILDGLKTEKEFRLSEIVDDVEYVKLETTPECLLSSAMYLVGKKYIVAVQPYGPAQVFLFDRSGKFLRKIGGEGKGPLEYVSISSVVTDPEETYLLVNDYQRDIIMKFDFDGKVILNYNNKEKLDADVSGMVIQSSDEIYLRMEYPRMEKKNFYLIRKMDANFNQLDSLYPVNTSLIAGNGFYWGGSDFYLHNGSIQFRQFSFDTLYGDSKGKMIPRFNFPVGADHLPGPYLVSGLHKQMGDYTSTLNFTELSEYLILNTRIVPKKGGVMLYNKQSGEIALLKKYPPCPPDTLGRRAILNDIDGIVNPRSVTEDRGICVMANQVIDLKDNILNSCPEVKEIKFPAKRQEFIGLINASKEDDNPILQIFLLR
jgi:hypothetical protein